MSQSIIIPLRIENVSYRISVTLVDLDTGEEEVLYEIERKRRCSFKKPFSYKDYSIQLRLDWKDIANGDPMLDANIYDRNTNEEIRRGPWHHTECKFDAHAGRKIYAFTFENIRLRLYIIRTMATSYQLDVVLKK